LGPLLVIESDELDFVNNGKDLEQIARQVETELAEAGMKI